MVAFLKYSLGKTKEHTHDEENTIAKIFEDAELTMTVPPDWLLTEQGISQIKYKPNGEFLSIHTSHYPIILTAIAKDIDEGTEHLTLKYKKEGKIYTLTADRKTLSEQRSITQISESGFPVNSVNAKQIIRYLEDFEAVNIACLKRSALHTVLGISTILKGIVSIIYLIKPTIVTN